MPTGTNIRTWFNGTWHDGDIAVMKAADHGMWLGSNVFDGALPEGAAGPYAQTKREGERRALASDRALLAIAELYELPCDVTLAPATSFKKGCSLAAVLRAMLRRERFGE